VNKGTERRARARSKNYALKEVVSGDETREIKMIVKLTLDEITNAQRGTVSQKERVEGIRLAG